ncbi:putative oxidoreductase [Cavenderia fasciculata]|uniref:Oxidoreductase n=1 Tax=Cavenderia fasciculata TaxID=261658 RepID=F4Q6Q6_CACFS|nr:putative oxidoreductase [Cavenderia fasciculata]EGG16566.1 putative oxidoreductase [Cavenderia fasciculata]|eukprot:XP_004354966.1 putative oxidoreductase [Cavenderia fasciculata]
MNSLIQKIKGTKHQQQQPEQSSKENFDDIDIDHKDYKHQATSEPSEAIKQEEKKYDQARQISIIVIGCGNRGYVYTVYAKERPNRLKVVAVADPIKFRREKIGGSFNLPQDQIYENWKDIVAKDKFADAVLISSPDVYHAEQAVAFANKGYNILLEKPMATSLEDCKRIVAAVKANNVILAVCHVLRYTPYTQKIKQLIDSGRIGKVLNITHLEPVGYFHAAHSYVRGNWSVEEKSSFMLLTKSCHDLDLIHYFMGEHCKKISSFGSLSYFKKENKPKEAGDAKSCLECPIVDRCPYSAKTIYLQYYPWKREVVVPDKEPTLQNVKSALVDGPYGRCVYGGCDNNVVDQQVVNLEFDSGNTASFSMVSFTQEMCVRKIVIHGSHGQLKCDGYTIDYDDFSMGDKEIFKPEMVADTRLTGHNGADYYLVRSFVYAVATNDPSQILSSADDTLQSHLLVFNAEQSRKEERVVKC